MLRMSPVVLILVLVVAWVSVPTESVDAAVTYSSPSAAETQLAMAELNHGAMLYAAALGAATGGAWGAVRGIGGLWVGMAAGGLTGAAYGSMAGILGTTSLQMTDELFYHAGDTRLYPRTILG